MAYGDFSLKDIKLKFGIENKVGELFDTIQLIELCKKLNEDLQLAKILPVWGEKAKKV